MVFKLMTPRPRVTRSTNEASQAPPCAFSYASGMLANQLSGINKIKKPPACSIDNWQIQSPGPTLRHPQDMVERRVGEQCTGWVSASPLFSI